MILILKCTLDMSLVGLESFIIFVPACLSFFSFFHQSAFISYIQDVYGTWIFSLATHEDPEDAGVLPASVAVVEGDASRSS